MGPESSNQERETGPVTERAVGCECGLPGRVPRTKHSAPRSQMPRWHLTGSRARKPNPSRAGESWGEGRAAGRVSGRAEGGARVAGQGRPRMDAVGRPRGHTDPQLGAVSSRSLRQLLPQWERPEPAARRCSGPFQQPQKTSTRAAVVRTGDPGGQPRVGTDGRPLGAGCGEGQAGTVSGITPGLGEHGEGAGGGRPAGNDLRAEKKKNGQIPFQKSKGTKVTGKKGGQ